MTSVLDYYVDANNAVHNLDIPNKDAIEALTRSAMRMIAVDLNRIDVPGFKGAVDTLDKLKAIEDYIRVKKAQQLADLVTQNKVAASRLYAVREIGKWLKIYLAPANRPKENCASRSTVNDDPEYHLDELNITRHQSADWQMIASIPTKEFDEWLNQFVSDAEKIEAELTLSKLLEYIRPQREKQPTKETPNLLPHVKTVYVDADNLLNHLPEMIRGICEGNTPKDQFIKVRDKLNELPEQINRALRQAGEMY